MNLKEKILALSIALIFVFFVHYGMNTFFKEPRYEDFCNASAFIYPSEKPIMASQSKFYACENITTEQLCKRMSGENICERVNQDQQESTQACYNEKGQPVYGIDSDGCSVYKGCNYCSRDFQDEQERYNRIVFIAAGIIGIIALVVGAAVLQLESVGSGIMGGGVITIIYGTIRYWGNLPDAGRFIILGISLAVLIWLGYKKLASTDKQSKKHKK